MNTPAKDYRVTIKVRNNRLLRAIIEAGGCPGSKWCSTHGLNYHTVNNLINLKASPLDFDGELRPVALRLCNILNKTPVDLWSPEQLMPLAKNVSEIEMGAVEISRLANSTDFSYLPEYPDLEREQARKLLDRALSFLRPQEQEVIRQRYDEDMTLREVADNLGVGPERVRQIEARALRVMRQPAVVSFLADAVESVSAPRRSGFRFG